MQGRTDLGHLDSREITTPQVSLVSHKDHQKSCKQSHIQGLGKSLWPYLLDGIQMIYEVQIQSLGQDKVLVRLQRHAELL